MKIEFIEMEAAWPYFVAGRLGDDETIIVEYHPIAREGIATVKRVSGSPLFWAFLKSQVPELRKVLPA